jgi:hypothetical protein
MPSPPDYGLLGFSPFQMVDVLPMPATIADPGEAGKAL